MIKDPYQGIASYLCYYYFLKWHLEQLRSISLPLRIFFSPGMPNYLTITQTGLGEG